MIDFKSPLREDFMEEKIASLEDEVKQLTESNQKLRVAMKAIVSNQHMFHMTDALNWRECDNPACRTARLALEIPCE